MADYTSNESCLSSRRIRNQVDFAQGPTKNYHLVRSRVTARLPPKRSAFNPLPGHSGFSHVGIVPYEAIGRRVFSGISRFPTISFPRCSILASVTLIGSQNPAQISSITLTNTKYCLLKPTRVKLWFAGNAKLKDPPPPPEKTRRPAASSGTIPTCENPGVTRPEIEPGSPRREASSLTAQPQRPEQHLRIVTCTYPQWNGPPVRTPRPTSRSEGAIRATVTRTPSASSLLRARRAVFPLGISHSRKPRRDEKTAKQQEVDSSSCAGMQLDQLCMLLRHIVLQKLCTIKLYTKTNGPIAAPSTVPGRTLTRTLHGAAVVWWSDYSSPTRASRVSIPAVSFSDFRKAGIGPGRWRCPAGLLECSSVFSALSFQRCSMLTSIYSQDLDLKYRPNLFDQLQLAYINPLTRYMCNAGRPQSVRTVRLEEVIRQHIHDIPSTSIRSIARQMGVSHSTVWGVLWVNHRHLYRWQKTVSTKSGTDCRRMISVNRTRVAHLQMPSRVLS
ncbi:hypothetical protein PR048_026987 [Dryococelus australis]|uniref:Transposase Tc1-like domain-containing protein n=1 Tax=Dryococelus australis TaxID=614101 RepID=A0ABQ9GMW7_9NEOP|nr:hypothetical protein PR048_026987 [Dryococelus australis]